MSTVKKYLSMGFFFLTFSGLAVMCLRWGVISLGRGEYPTCVVVFATAIAFIGLQVSLGLILRARVTPRVESNGRGTTIRPDRVADLILVWATVVAVVAVAVYAIFSLQNKIDIPPPYGSQRTYSLAAVILALTGAVNLWQMFRRGGVSCVRLTPNGFDMSQGSSSIHGEWDDVIDIAAHRPGKPPPVRATLFVKFGNGRVRTQVIDSYTPRGEALRRLVRYYWIYPDRRDELTDGRVIDRLAEFEA